MSALGPINYLPMSAIHLHIAASARSRTSNASSAANDSHEPSEHCAASSDPASVAPPVPAAAAAATTALTTYTLSDLAAHSLQSSLRNRWGEPVLPPVAATAAERAQSGRALAVACGCSRFQCDLQLRKPHFGASSSSLSADQSMSALSVSPSLSAATSSCLASCQSVWATVEERNRMLMSAASFQHPIIESSGLRMGDSIALQTVAECLLARMPGQLALVHSMIQVCFAFELYHDVQFTVNFGVSDQLLYELNFQFYF
jgi:hypothetical protein